MPGYGKRAFISHCRAPAGLVTLLAGSLIIAVVPGAAFSMAYPRVAIDFNLALLFTLLGAAVAGPGCGIQPALAA